MLKKLLVLWILASSLAACASWYDNDQPEESDSPTVGSKNGSSELFGVAESSTEQSA